jgi:hypothetical protein
MMITSLPNEIQYLILNQLSNGAIAQLCLCNKAAYRHYLPLLYRNLDLGYRTHIKQLEQGLLRNDFLRETIQNNTTTITLRSKNGGSGYWPKLSLYPFGKLETIVFRDFISLPMAKVRLFLKIPTVTQALLYYCHLSQTENKTDVFRSSLKNLELKWTDFSPESIRQLLELTPNLTRIELGANHNKTKMANDWALCYLKQYCMNIQHLAISLQQVKEESICDLIKQYADQLETIQMRSDHLTLKTTALYASQLKQLNLRGPEQEILVLLEKCKLFNGLKNTIEWM